VTDDDRVVLRYATASNVSTIDSEWHRESVYAGPHLLVVASGIQHMSSPVLPSVLAVEELRRLDAPAGDSDLGPSLERGLEGLRDVFRRLVASDPSSKGTGVLLTAMRWRGPHAAIAHIGRSRAYMLRGGQLTRLTRDHTVGQLRMEAGEIRPDEMYTDINDNPVFRWLDDECTEPADIIAHEAAIGDRYVLCTDAIERIMSAETLLDIVSNTASGVRDVADGLAAMAFSRAQYLQFGCVVGDVVERAG
jgi:serine/threonine protein phosphatase PrpC